MLLKAATRMGRESANVQQPKAVLPGPPRSDHLINEQLYLADRQQASISTINTCVTRKNVVQRESFDHLFMQIDFLWIMMKFSRVEAMEFAQSDEMNRFIGLDGLFHRQSGSLRSNDLFQQSGYSRFDQILHRHRGSVRSHSKPWCL